MINPFVPNAPFLSPLKTSDFYTPWKRQKTFGWCFQGVEKECIGNKWVNGTKQTTTVYKLDTKSIQVTFNKKPLKRTFSFKLLGMLWDRYFFAISCEKTAVQSMVLSRFHHCNALLSNIPKYKKATAKSSGRLGCVCDEEMWHG